MCLLSLGCNQLQRPQHDNPVMHAPPRRLSWDDSHLTQNPPPEQNTRTSSTLPASYLPVDDDVDDKLFHARVVARVNGVPVFAGEVLDRWGPVLQKARDRLNTDDYRRLRDAVIQVNLRGQLERKLLAERFRSTLKQEQIKMLEQHVDRLFEKEIDKLKAEMHVATRTELEQALNERGTTLAAIRDNFITQRLAIEYVASHIERPPAVTRPEIVAYYQEHLDEYTIPARVMWQHLQISWSARTSRQEAYSRMQQAYGDLLQGRDFTSVVQKYSDGPRTRHGGVWDWTTQGSLADHILEEVLFQLPVGALSDIIEGKTAFHVVKVLDRQPETRRSLSEVQDEIIQKLEEQRRDQAPQRFVEELYRAAIIESEYDLSDSAVQSAGQAMMVLFQKAGINPSRM